MHDYWCYILLTCARNDAAICDLTVGERSGGRLLSAAIFTQPILDVQYHSDEGKIERGDPRLMRLEETKQCNTAMYPVVWYHTSRSKVVMAGEGVGTYLGGVPIVEGVFRHEVPQGGDSRPPHVSHLTQRHLDLVEEQPDQEVVLTELVRQSVVMLQVCNINQVLVSFRAMYFTS